MKTQTKQILLVDNQVQLTDVLSLFLSKRGFNTVVCRDSSSAISYLEERGQDIDLVIADLTVDSHAGDNIANLTELASFNIPMIVTSASLPLAQNTISKKGLVHVLPKPFTASQLLCHIDRILEPTEKPGKSLPLMMRNLVSQRRSVSRKPESR